MDLLLLNTAKRRLESLREDFRQARRSREISCLVVTAADTDEGLWQLQGPTPGHWLRKVAGIEGGTMPPAFIRVEDSRGPLLKSIFFGGVDGGQAEFKDLAFKAGRVLIDLPPKYGIPNEIHNPVEYLKIAGGDTYNVLFLKWVIYMVETARTALKELPGSSLHADEYFWLDDDEIALCDRSFANVPPPFGAVLIGNAFTTSADVIDTLLAKIDVLLTDKNIPPPSKPKEPPTEAWACYMLKKEYGKNQTDIGAIMDSMYADSKTKRTFSQPTVSRMLTEVEHYIASGGYATPPHTVIAQMRAKLGSGRRKSR